MIFTFDNKDQQMWEVTQSCVPNFKESEWIRKLIHGAFPDEDINLTEDLSKISMAISYKSKAVEKLPMIQDFLKRNGKYYFQSDQRDEVENEIIKGTVIASETKELKQTKEEFDREQFKKSAPLAEALRKSEALL